MQHIIVDVASADQPNPDKLSELHERLVSFLNIQRYKVQLIDEEDVAVLVTCAPDFLLTSVLELTRQTSMTSLYCKDLPNTKRLLDEFRHQFPGSAMICCIYDHCNPSVVTQRDSFLVLDGGALDLPLSVEVLTDPSKS